MTALERIRKRVLSNGPLNRYNLPMLTLEEFFEGNDDDDSLAVNCDCSIGEIYDFFKSIKNRADVSDIRVQVTDLDDNAWPFSELVWFATTADAEEVIEWFPEKIAPDDSRILTKEEVDAEKDFHEPYPLPNNYHYVVCWWD